MTFINIIPYDNFVENTTQYNNVIDFESEIAEGIRQSLESPSQLYLLLMSYGTEIIEDVSRETFLKFHNQNLLTEFCFELNQFMDSVSGRGVSDSIAKCYLFYVSNTINHSSSLTIDSQQIKEYIQELYNKIKK